MSVTRRQSAKEGRTSELKEGTNPPDKSTAFKEAGLDVYQSPRDMLNRATWPGLRDGAQRQIKGRR